MSIRDQLDSVNVKVEVDESELCGIKVFVRKVSYKEFKEFTDKELHETVAKILCDEAGERLYKDEEAESLTRFHIDDLRKVITDCQKFNGLDEQARQVKNS